jgi:hypothetical protein
LQLASLILDSSDCVYNGQPRLLERRLDVAIVGRPARIAGQSPIKLTARLFVEFWTRGPLLHRK